MKSEWTVTILKEYFDKLFSELKEFVNKRIDEVKEFSDKRWLEQKSALENTLAATNKATEKEEANSRAWRENANEWRGSMKDREDKFVSKSEFQAELRGLKSTLFIMLTAFIATVVTIIGGALVVISKMTK